MREGDVKREGDQVREKNQDIDEEKERRGKGGGIRNGGRERERDGGRGGKRESKIKNGTVRDWWREW